MLRYGAFYGPDTGVFDAALIEADPQAPRCHSSAAALRVVKVVPAKSMTPREATALAIELRRKRRLQYSRRRTRAGPRMAARDRRNARRKAAVPRAGMGRSSGGRRTPRRYDDAIARGIERQGEAGTQLASPSSFLAAGIR